MKINENDRPTDSTGARKQTGDAEKQTQGQVDLSFVYKKLDSIDTALCNLQQKNVSESREDSLRNLGEGLRNAATSDLMTIADSLKGDIQSIKNEIESKIGTIKDKLENVKDTLNGSLPVDLSSLSQNVAETKSTVGELSKKVGSANETLSTVNSNVAKTNSTVGELSKKVGSANDTLSTVKNNVSGITSTVDKLLQKADSSKKTLSDIHDNIIDDVKKPVGELSKQVDGVKKTLSSIEETVNGIEETVSDIPAILDSVEDIGNILEKVDDIQTQIEDGSNAVTSIESHASKMESCAVKISDAASSIYGKAQLSARFNDLGSQIYHIGDKIDNGKASVNKAINDAESNIKQHVDKKTPQRSYLVLTIAYSFMILISTIVLIYLNRVGIDNVDLLITADVFLGVSVVAMFVLNLFTSPTYNYPVNYAYYIACGLFSLTAFILSLVGLYM